MTVAPWTILSSRAAIANARYRQSPSGCRSVGTAGLVGPAVDAAMQINKPALEIGLILLPRHVIHAGCGSALQRVEPSLDCPVHLNRTLRALSCRDPKYVGAFLFELGFVHQRNPEHCKTFWAIMRLPAYACTVQTARTVFRFSRAHPVHGWDRFFECILDFVARHSLNQSDLRCYMMDLRHKIAFGLTGARRHRLRVVVFGHELPLSSCLASDL